MRKSLLALHQTGHGAALVISSSAGSPIGMITVTDCLRAVVVASSIDPAIGDRSIRDFIKVYGKKKLIAATINMSSVFP
ncbi:unnamed protein product [Gongylonema pulchrum]|uniref:CBS domain-containing protein n=1 Tax=Gongylonema pulchrum TaxID=637853 RepID=A0A183DHS5_9BILA|nr:unnamed protein product [Gongylonema pulchrum]